VTLLVIRVCRSCADEETGARWRFRFDVQGVGPSAQGFNPTAGGTRLTGINKFSCDRSLIIIFMDKSRCREILQMVALGTILLDHNSPNYYQTSLEEHE
jgi:hypothetical protein